MHDGCSLPCMQGKVTPFSPPVVIVCKQSDSRGLVALSAWECGGSAMARFLEGDGRHFLQKECRQGRSLGSRLWKLRLHTGQVSRGLRTDLSSCTGMLSASFSTTMTAAAPPVSSIPVSSIHLLHFGPPSGCLHDVPAQVSRPGIREASPGNRASPHTFSSSITHSYFILFLNNKNKQ